MKKTEGMGIRGILASRLKTLRTAARRPLKHIAAELNIPISTLSAWEHGTRFPSAENLERLARWYGFHPCQMLDMEFKISAIACSSVSSRVRNGGVDHDIKGRDGIIHKVEI